MKSGVLPGDEVDTKTVDEVESPAGVTADRYADIVKVIHLAGKGKDPCDLKVSETAVPILLQEARLLDDRRYRDWLDLLTPDYVYWIPGSEEIDDPRVESAVNFDDHRRMVDRITLIETGELHAQIPPSRTCRAISNVEAWPYERDRLLVRSNLAIWAYRRGTLSTFVGSQLHELVASAASWSIRTRIIRLLDCDEPQGNVTFIL